jgi:hypothetical protein
LKGKGAALRLPALPLTLPARVQLVVREGTSLDCWEATYSDELVNESERFKAKSD